MIFDWYKIINKAEFLAADLVSKEVEVFLEGVGVRNILVTKGNLVSILYEGVFLSIGLTDENPFIFAGHAVYVDDNDDIWLGIQTNED